MNSVFTLQIKKKKHPGHSVCVCVYVCDSVSASQGSCARLYIWNNNYIWEKRTTEVFAMQGLLEGFYYIPRGVCV